MLVGVSLATATQVLNAAEKLHVDLHNQLNTLRQGGIQLTYKQIPTPSTMNEALEQIKAYKERITLLQEALIVNAVIDSEESRQFEQIAIQMGLLQEATVLV